jgi:probable rRNA maturation factor
LAFQGCRDQRAVVPRPANRAGRPHCRRLLGDIVIAYETTEREARAEHKSFAHHLAHLAVHGFLHLAGYDHQADDEAAVMERLETGSSRSLPFPIPILRAAAPDRDA